MLCLCVDLGWVLLMQLLGWVTLHDTHHHMEVLRKILYLVFLGVWIFGLLQDGSQVSDGKVERVLRAQLLLSCVLCDAWCVE